MGPSSYHEMVTMRALEETHSFYKLVPKGRVEAGSLNLANPPPPSCHHSLAFKSLALKMHTHVPQAWSSCHSILVPKYLM
jgi:hypothetical protein